MTGLLILLAVVIATAAITICVTAWLEEGNRQIDAALAACLDDEAADHDEPSRNDVEATWTREALERVIAATENPWLFDALEFSETPIHDEIAVERLRSELDCESAVVLWLGRGA